MNFGWYKYLIYLLDICIVCYIVYRFIVLIRGTRAMQIFLGLVAIGLLTLIAVKLELPLTAWLLKQFWVAGIIVLAIVFQPELRNMLAELYPPKHNTSYKIKNIEEIISAVKELSEKHIGALIVVERSTGLKDFTLSGVVLNADLTKELLLNIFYPNNVLHDGATIISKDKILAARCILPLSEEVYCKDYGTRHRAACGIAQVTDAVSIVVSEQTGKISFVEGKNFYTGITLEQLRKFLSDFIVKSTT